MKAEQANACFCACKGYLVHHLKKKKYEGLHLHITLFLFPLLADRDFRNLKS